jgi:hypothetical protein
MTTTIELAPELDTILNRAISRTPPETQGELAAWVVRRLPTDP